MTAELGAIGGATAAAPRTGSLTEAPAQRAPTTRSESRTQAPQVADSQSPEDVGLVFEVGQNGQDLVIKIVDRQSQRIIRQIPPEEIQRFRQAIRDLVGLLLDQTG